MRELLYQEHRRQGRNILEHKLTPFENPKGRALGMLYPEASTDFIAWWACNSMSELTLIDRVILGGVQKIVDLIHDLIQRGLVVNLCTNCSTILRIVRLGDP